MTQAAGQHLDIALELEAKLKAILDAKSGDMLSVYAPYPKQIEFHAFGNFFGQRLFQAPNQSGKTVAGAFEIAAHATGRYPEWWPGRKWARPTKGWIAGESTSAVRETSMNLLLGTEYPFSMPDKVGTGTIPKDCILKLIPAHGGGELVATILVKHKNGGVSSISSKTYEQERGKWQGSTLDYIWFDEEPPEDIYVEGLARITATNGFTFMTFTPLKGMTKVVGLFYKTDSTDRKIIKMGAEDAGHFTPELIEKLKARYPDYQHAARIHGEIAQGQGSVWQFSENLIKTPRVKIAPQWFLIAGIDFGINQDHPQAGAWIAWDKDSDIIYLYDCYKQPNALIDTHAAVLRSRGVDIPVSWPQDGWARDKKTGEGLAAQYKKPPNSVKMLPEHATWPEGGLSHEAFVMDFESRASTGRFKVFDDQFLFLEEFRGYHRKDGLVVKQNDDIISALKCAMMMKRYARQVDTIGALRGRTKQGMVAKNVEFDVLTGRAYR